MMSLLLLSTLLLSISRACPEKDDDWGCDTWDQPAIKHCCNADDYCAWVESLSCNGEGGPNCCVDATNEPTNEPTNKPTNEPTTAAPTTSAPTTSSPTTSSPTTSFPTTASPTTSSPTTTSPTTSSPTTSSPTTTSPTTSQPTTSSPTTSAPTTSSPTTSAPTTSSPTTSSPTTSSPTTSSPTTASPTTSSPTTASPTTSSPTTASPTTSQPTTATPTTSSPTTSDPTTATPTTASPTTVSPTTATPTTATPTTASPTTSDPTTAQPTTAQPTTAEPTTAEPTTNQPTPCPYTEPSVCKYWRTERYQSLLGANFGGAPLDICFGDFNGDSSTSTSTVYKCSADGSTVEKWEYTGSANCDGSPDQVTPVAMDPTVGDEFSCDGPPCPYYLFQSGTAHPSGTCPFDLGTSFADGAYDYATWSTTLVLAGCKTQGQTSELLVCDEDDGILIHAFANPDCDYSGLTSDTEVYESCLIGQCDSGTGRAVQCYDNPDPEPCPTEPQSTETDPAESYPCITSCDGLDGGDYQSCLGCDVYATCSNGILHDNRKCQCDPDGIDPSLQTFWDDNLKVCTYVSETCRDTTITNTDPWTTTTTTQSGAQYPCVENPCVTNWGYYQSCDGCDKFIQCVWGTPVTQSCAAGTEWDNNKQTCVWEGQSQTCGGSQGGNPAGGGVNSELSDNGGHSIVGDSDGAENSDLKLFFYIFIGYVFLIAN